MKASWVSLCRRLMFKEEFIVAGVQRIHRRIRWQLDPEQFFGDMTLEDTGYTQTKIKQLQRHYWDQASFDRAKSDYHWRIDHRKYGSGICYFRGIPKKNTRQDYCITSMTIGYYPKHGTIIDINYRTTEVIKRFRGDLIFFRDYVVPYFEIRDLIEVNFSFTNITFHPMFFILLAPHMDIIKCLAELRHRNFRLYRDCIYWCFRYLFWQESVNKYSSARQVIRIADQQCDTSKLQSPVRRFIIEDINHFPDSAKRWAKQHEQDLQQLSRGAG